MRPVNLSIYKHRPWVNEGYDPSNGGISLCLDDIYVFPEEATKHEIAEWCLKLRVRPSEVCRLNKRMLWGEKHYFIEPVMQPKHKVGPMFGGNFAYTSNGIFADFLGERITRPIPIHDRFETQEEYDLLSC